MNACKIYNLLEQVEELKATSAEKDTLIAKYEAIVKENKGQVILLDVLWV